MNSTGTTGSSATGEPPGEELLEVNQEDLLSTAESSSQEVASLGEEFQIEGRTFHQPGFATGDKKALFTTVNIPRSNGEKGQFRMASIRSEGQFNTIIYEEYDSFREIDHRWTVLMNTNDMAALRLKEGDKVTIKNDIGSMEGVAVKGFDIPPGDYV